MSRPWFAVFERDVTVIFDTDVLIWCLRGNVRAADIIDKTPERHISTISYMELLEGARDKQEIRSIKRFLHELDFQSIPLSENIGHRAIIYMEEYGLQIGMCPADALIAATAVEEKLEICTANKKHYKPIKELDVVVFKP